MYDELCWQLSVSLFLDKAVLKRACLPEKLGNVKKERREKGGKAVDAVNSELSSLELRFAKAGVIITAGTESPRQPLRRALNSRVFVCKHLRSWPLMELKNTVLFAIIER